MHIYVDGSYNPATKVWGGGAILINDKENIIFKKLTVSGQDTNGSYQINGEVQSTLVALQYLIDHVDEVVDDKIVIYYDYLGIEKWATNEWTARKEVSKDYQSKVIKQILVLRHIHNLDVSFEKVKAHSGVHYNEEVDKLAKIACGVELIKRSALFFFNFFPLQCT